MGVLSSFTRSRGGHVDCFAAGDVATIPGPTTTYPRCERCERQEGLHVALIRAAREWSATFDAVDCPFFIVDEALDVVRLNEPGRQLLGRPFAEIVGRGLTCFGTGEPWRGAAVLAARAFRSGEPAEADVWDDATGRAWQLHATPAALGEDPRVILSARDITRTAELQELLRRSETMSAVGALVTGVAHELRNPLFSISSTLEAFEARFGAAPEYDRYLRILRAEVKGLSTLAQELVEYGRPPAGELTVDAVADAVEAAVRTCDTLARLHRVQVVQVVPAARVRMNRRRLEQVIVNLVENAILHSPPGGRVVVSGRVVDDQVELTVADSGSGFRPDDHGRVFEPFFTRRRGGTGLGLSIVQRVVEDHGGTVATANRPEGGALVSVTLPLATEPTEG